MELNRYPVLVPDNCRGLSIRTPNDAWVIESITNPDEYQRIIEGMLIEVEAEDRLVIFSGKGTLTLGVTDTKLMVFITSDAGDGRQHHLAGLTIGGSAPGFPRRTLSLVAETGGWMPR